jgi:hypothetical protein
MATNPYDPPTTPSDVAATSDAAKRPVIITVLAWVLIVSGVFFLIMKPLTWSHFSLERNLWNVFSKSLSLLCGVGLLKMRKWAVLLYFVGYALNAVLLFVWPPNAEALELCSQPPAIAVMLVVPMVFALITLPKWKLMTWGSASQHTGGDRR